VKTSNRQMRGGSSGMHPERRVTLDSVRVDFLPPHPLSVKIYGKPKPSKELLESLQKVGLLQPLVINDFGDGSFQLLVGNTRAEAWRILLKQKKVSTVWVPCRFVKLSPLEAETLVIESNRQRVKTPEMKAREFKELKIIEQKLAKDRMASRLTAKESERGEAVAKAAACVGMGANTAKKIETLVDAADGGSEKARIALNAINAGEQSIAGAYRKIVKPKHSESIKAGIQEARRLTELFKNGEVFRSRQEGLFHVTIRDITPDQVRKLAKEKL
jgi:ParB-like chromosome segregation protein Spo0J